MGITLSACAGRRHSPRGFCTATPPGTARRYPCTPSGGCRRRGMLPPPQWGGYTGMDQIAGVPPRLLPGKCYRDGARVPTGPLTSGIPIGGVAGRASLHPSLARGHRSYTWTVLGGVAPPVWWWGPCACTRNRAAGMAASHHDARVSSASLVISGARCLAYDVTACRLSGRGTRVGRGRGWGGVWRAW